MQRGLRLLAALFGFALLVPVAYVACSGDSPGTADGADSGPLQCTRPSRYSSLRAIEQQGIMLWAEYQEEYNIVLTPAQENRLATEHTLKGEFEDLARPVKFPNGDVDMRDGWLPDLPPGHPWLLTPSATDPTFAAWFEVRIVDPLLYDRDLTEHVSWAASYLDLVNGGSISLTSIIGADSGCP